MLENTSIYNLNRIHFHKPAVGGMICRREGWKVSVNILFSQKSFLFNIKIETPTVCVLQLCLVKICGYTSEGNLVNVNLSVVEI